jgi:hypothetical protein
MRLDQNPDRIGSPINDSRVPDIRVCFRVGLIARLAYPHSIAAAEFSPYTSALEARARPWVALGMWHFELTSSDSWGLLFGIITNVPLVL